MIGITFPRWDVHVHTLVVPHDLETIALPQTAISQHLSAAEQERYDRYLVKKKRVEFFLARCFSKKLLAETLEMPEDVITFDIAPSGKPFLRVADQVVPLFFNISHTRGLISCVVSRCSFCGVDVERLDGANDDLFRRFFHPREINIYNSLPPRSRDEHFYTVWTLKEAFLKANGDGLSTPLNSFWFSLSTDRDQPAITLHCEKPAHEKDMTGYQFHSSHPTPRHVLAVAVHAKNTVRFIHHLHRALSGFSFPAESLTAYPPLSQYRQALLYATQHEYAYQEAPWRCP